MRLIHVSPSARVIRTFFRQKQANDRFSQSSNSVSRTNYIRILALASIDVLLTLPFGITNIVLDVTNSLAEGFLPVYPGWVYDHTDWAPVSFTYAETEAIGTAGMVQQYFSQWTSPILAFAIFGLFGVTTEARASYMRAIVTTGHWLGWAPAPSARNAHSTLGTIEFGERPQDMLSLDKEVGFVLKGVLLHQKLD